MTPDPRGLAREAEAASEPLKELLQLAGQKLPADREGADEVALQNLVAGTAAVAGEDFFPTLVKHLAAALQVSCALVSEVTDAGLWSVACWHDGVLLPRFSYPDDTQTPGAKTLREGRVFCSSHAQREFPDDSSLVALEAESYLGVALRDRRGAAVGTLCICNKGPIRQPQRAEQILQVFAARAAAELERRRMEESLQQALQKLDFHINNSPAGVIEWDRESRVQGWSRRAEEIFGWAAEEVLGKHFDELALVYPEDAATVAETVRCLQQECAPRNTSKHRNLTRDGRVIYCEWHSSCLRDESGVLQSVLSVILDVSDRKQAEQALRQSEERFRQAIDTAPFPIVLHAEDGEVLKINDVWTELTGYTHRDIPTMRDWAERAYGERADDILKTVIAKKYDLDSRWDEGEFIVATREGTRRIWQFSSAPLGELPDGRRAVISMAVDVTERKYSEARYRAVYDRVAVGLASSSFDGRLLDVNSRFCEMLGYTRAELLQKTVSEVTHPEDRPRTKLELDKLFTGEISCFFQEKRYLRKDGSEFWSSTGVSVVKDGTGGPAYSLGVIRDITDRKVTEAALRESENRYRLLAENSNDLVCLHEPDGRYLYVSQSSQPLLGYHYTEMVGRDPYEFLHPEDRDRIQREAREQAVAGFFSVPVTYRMRTKSGAYIWFETLTKPILDECGRVARLQTTSRDITERIKAQELLVYEARHDRLTGLPNRAFLIERLELALQLLKRKPQRQFALLFLDLDRFKVVNDSLGHLVGDRVLAAIAARLHCFIRSSDLAARLGGDEFVLLLSAVTGIEAAVRVAERVAADLSAPIDLDGREIVLGASIGVALGKPSYERAEDILRDADLAMYRAKSRGSSTNKIEVFDNVLHARALKRLHLENDLRQALQQDEFVVEYQPIVSLTTSQIVSFEALIRWQHPERGRITPEEFVPIAEETGAIVSIDRWVLKTACQDLAMWHQRYPRAATVKVGVNLCARDLHSPNFSAEIERVLEESGLPGQYLTLEITESMLLADIERTTALLDRLKALGVRISLDDFGTGYSSLAYLHQLPANNLKIDRSFVSRVPSDRRSCKIIETVIALSNSLGIEAIAEGIETQQQLELLSELGCELGQGFYFAKALSAERVGKLLDGKEMGCSRLATCDNA